MNILFSKKCLEYGQRGHPESAERVAKTVKLLAQKGYELRVPQSCHEEDLFLVHGRGHVENVKNGTLSDVDTPNLPRIFEYASLSAGSAINAMQFASQNQMAFSLMRPPGHHAGTHGAALGTVSLGFCYFNNIAIASQKALEVDEVEKMAIIDIDCHHGNGTQEIFFGNPRVLFVSLHRFGFFYPGTGSATEKNCLNFPLNYRIGELEFLNTLKLGLKHVRRFDPELIGVSAGFDTYKGDPVGGLGLDINSYFTIGKMLKKLRKRIFIVLEGGYGQDFPQCVLQFLLGLDA